MPAIVVSFLFSALYLAGTALLVIGGPPTVKLDEATVIGVTEGTSTSFLGIPFAQAPYVHCLIVHSLVFD